MIDDPQMWRSIKKLPGSETLDPLQIGVDGRYALSTHYEVVMPGSYRSDSQTGLRVWSEPMLVLFVSVTRPDWPPDTTRVLHYGLTRSLWVSSAEPSAPDRTRLMAASAPFFKVDIEQPGTADVPDTLSKMRSL